MRNIMDNRWDVQQSVQVSGIWFLEQGDEDGSVLLGKGEGAGRLYHSAVQISAPCFRKADNEGIYTDWHGSLFIRCCEAVSGLSCGVLTATLDGSFWDYM